jgi:hypothetical protein
MSWWMLWRSRAARRRTVPCWGEGAEAQPETASSAKQDPASDGKASGHGRNEDAAFESARKAETRHQQLKSGDRLLTELQRRAAELLGTRLNVCPGTTATRWIESLAADFLGLCRAAEALLSF